MKKISIKIFLVSLLSLLSIISFSQAERKFIREGNKEYKKAEFEKSEVAFKKAAEMQPELYQVRQNVGAATFRQQKYEDASNAFSGYMLAARSQKEQAVAWYNMGTAFLQSGDYQKSIDALQKAIILNPKDDDARYNLTVAQYMQSKQSGEGGGGNNNQQQNQQQQNQQQQQDQQNKDKQQQQQQQQQSEQISKEDAERILKAMDEDEKKIQQKIQEEKAKANKVKVEKDW